MEYFTLVLFQWDGMGWDGGGAPIGVGGKKDRDRDRDCDCDCGLLNCLLYFTLLYYTLLYLFQFLSYLLLSFVYFTLPHMSGFGMGWDGLGNPMDLIFQWTGHDTVRCVFVCGKDTPEFQLEKPSTLWKEPMHACIHTYIHVR